MCLLGFNVYGVDVVGIFGDSNTCRQFFHPVPGNHDSVIGAWLRRWANKGVAHFGADNAQVFAEVVVACHASGYNLGNF